MNYDTGFFSFFILGRTAYSSSQANKLVSDSRASMHSYMPNKPNYWRKHARLYKKHSNWARCENALMLLKPGIENDNVEWKQIN